MLDCVAVAKDDMRRSDCRCNIAMGLERAWLACSHISSRPMVCQASTAV